MVFCNGIYKNKCSKFRTKTYYDNLTAKIDHKSKKHIDWD
jgi:hypothetical protein